MLENIICLISDQGVSRTVKYVVGHTHTERANNHSLEFASQVNVCQLNVNETSRAAR